MTEPITHVFSIDNDIVCDRLYMAVYNHWNTLGSKRTQLFPIDIFEEWIEENTLVSLARYDKKNNSLITTFESDEDFIMFKLEWE